MQINSFPAKLAFFCATLLFWLLMFTVLKSHKQSLSIKLKEVIKCLTASRRIRNVIVLKAHLVCGGHCGLPQSYTTDCEFSKLQKLDWKPELAPQD